MVDAARVALQESIRLFDAQKFDAAYRKSSFVIEDSSASPQYKAKAYYICALCEEKKGNINKAFELAKASHKLNPDDKEIHYFIGSLHLTLGDRERSLSHFEKTLAIDPDHVNAWQRLVGCKQYTDENDADLKKIVRLLKSDKVKNDTDKSTLYFALGKIYDDLSKYDFAMDCYFNANYLRHERFDSGMFEMVADGIKQQFTKDYIEQFQRALPYENFNPIFIVGVPRSGTSLIEQILSCHSSVYGAGEILDIVMMIAQLPQLLQVKDVWTAYKEITNKTLDDLGNDYKKYRLSFVSHSETAVVNKSPLNFMYLGFIKCVLPNAKIIYARRHPGDTCASCFFRPFSSTNDYAFDLVHLGYYYRKSIEMMEHWQNVLGKEFIFDLPYETLIKSPEKKIREMIEFCDLEWEPACLEHEKLTRRVLTPSQLQVKQPLYQTSIGRWEHYKKWMAPLLGLNKEIDHYERGVDDHG